MREEILREIGLTKSEIKVYLALLELGSSSTGKIVEKSRASSSKIYEILDKLMQKGLVSFIVKGGVKYFEAAPPERIMDYMKEREEQFDRQKEEMKKLLPELELKQKLAKYKSEATIFKGLKGGETAFRYMINSMKKDDEWIGFVVSSVNQKYFDLLTKLHEWGAKKGLKARIIMNERHKNEGEEREKMPNTKVKYVPGELQTPTIINVAGNITLLNIMAEEITVFMIENKDVAESFRNQFEKMWEQKVQKYEDIESVEYAYNSLLKEAKPDDEVVMFAAKPESKRSSDFNLKWNEEIRKKVKRNRLMYYGWTDINIKRAKDMENINCETKILPTKQSLPISTVVLGNKILNTVWQKKPLAFIIDDKMVADSFRENFELLWGQKVRIYEGLEQIKHLIKQTLDFGDYDVFAEGMKIVDTLGEDFFVWWQNEKKRMGIKSRGIMGEKYRDLPTVTKSITQFKFISGFESPGLTFIFKDKVINMMLSKEPIAFLIDNKEVADSNRIYFELLWKQDVIVRKGIRNIENTFDMMLDELNPGDEYYVLGASWMGYKDRAFDYFIDFHRRRHEKGVKAKFLFISGTEKIIEKYKESYSRLTEIKYLPPNVYEGMQINIYKNKVLFFVWREDDPIVFSIEDKTTHDTFKTYFDALWSTSKN